MKQIGRNDPCPCGSGKKFKKCCEVKAHRSRFSASKIDPASAPQIQKAAGLTSLFRTSTLAIPKKTTPEPQEAVPTSQDPEPALPLPSVEIPKLEGNGKDLIPF